MFCFLNIYLMFSINLYYNQIHQYVKLILDIYIFILFFITPSHSPPGSMSQSPQKFHLKSDLISRTCLICHKALLYRIFYLDPSKIRCHSQYLEHSRTNTSLFIEDQPLE